MSNPEAYVQEIDSLTAEIKRLNTHVKNLREQRKVAQGHLYNYMESHSLEKYRNHTIASVRPRPKKPRKPESQKKQDAIELFREAGIPDPESFFTEFKATQKYEDGEEPSERPISKPKKKKNPNEDYDPFLGF